MRTIFTILVCLALAPVVSGCHGTAAEVCDQQCDCQGCSDNEYDECIINYESGIDNADAYGCGDDFVRAHDCVVVNNDCLADVFLPEAECADELVDLSQCIDGNSAIR